MVRPRASKSKNDVCGKKKAKLRPRICREDIFVTVARHTGPQNTSLRDTHRLAEDIADSLRLGCEAKASDIDFYDLRSEQDYNYPHGKKKARMHGAMPVHRDPAQIDTIVIHQTGVEFGVSKHAIKANGGDHSLALARRALDVASHTMAFRSGFFVASHPLSVYLNAAGRFNVRSCSLEIDGRYPGLMDNPSTLAREDLQTTWKGEPTELTEVTVDTACRALEWMVEEGARMGIEFKRIAAHRQSSDNRLADPGEEIWKRVVLGFAEPVLGLEVYRESPWRKGRPIPQAWDEKGSGAY